MSINFLVESPSADTTWLNNYNMEYYLELKQLTDYAKDNVGI